MSAPITLHSPETIGNPDYRADIDWLRALLEDTADDCRTDEGAAVARILIDTLELIAGGAK